MFYMLHGIAFVVVALLSQTLGASEIKVPNTIEPLKEVTGGINTSDRNNMMMITGEIKKGDYNNMISIIKKIGYIPNTLAINSPGGDVLEAIKIGRFARRALMSTSSEDCYGSCFLILAGGTNRRAYEPVGLHKPIYGKSYFSELTSEDTQKEYVRLDGMVRKYLMEIDVPIDIVDKMMSTPYESVFVWDGWEATITFSKRGGHAPAYYEWISEKCGRLSEQEEKDFSTIQTSGLKDAFGVNEKYKNSESTKKYQSMSKSYREYLENKQQEIWQCERETSKAERKKIYNSLN